ncbi:hypothetical protein CEP53_009002 [Fusarium sp. AF-6]|nr:hypothetical protein CEP53_009002 [Fusarium sp. AF-6]
MRVREDGYVPRERAPAAGDKSLTSLGLIRPKGREAFSAGAEWLVHPGDSLSEDEPLLAHFVTARLGIACKLLCPPAYTTSRPHVWLFIFFIYLKVSVAPTTPFYTASPPSTRSLNFSSFHFRLQPAAVRYDPHTPTNMTEPYIKSEGYIKPDPENSGSPAQVDEDDLYEDAGDLEFFDKNAANRAFETLYLARVPRYMWDAWIKLTERLGDDDEIRIGTLRTWTEQKPDGSANTKLRMLLSDQCPEHQMLPREYDLEVLEPNVNNHFIFSEEDLPGYKAQNKARHEAVNAGIPNSLLRKANNNNGGSDRPSYDRRSRYQPYYRKAVPKRTKIFGKIHYDVRVEPRDVREEERLLAQRLQDAEQSKSKMKIISRNKASAIINPGATGSAGWAGGFIKNTAPINKPKKGEVFKAARIPENQLLDLIFECFRQYQYWSMKALRQKLQQPDQYLRQVLEKVAVLNKSGRFANHYCLSDAYRDKGGAESKEAAAEPIDDDDDEEMEDVLPVS